MEAVRLQNIFFSYSYASPPVLSGIRFVVHYGDYISIVGSNGSGKSTLMKIILGLIRPTRGDISMDVGRIGYVPQRFENINIQFPITVDEVLSSYKHACGIKNSNAVTEALAAVRMTEYRHRLIGSLSGGQCQKIFIARALMGSPDLLILDEPSTGIDAKNQKEIYSIIKKINVSRGITVLSVEHNLRAAVRNSTALYHMKNGRGHLCDPESFLKENISDTTRG